jgi:hypothetical protein
MEIAVRRRTLASALFLAAAIVACETESSRERRLPTSPATGTPPVILTRLEFTGPDTIHIDRPAQYTLTADYSDGSKRDVTSEAVWHYSQPDLATLTAPGVFTGRAKGQTAISASTAGRTATVGNVIVVPQGTYRLLGTVRDAGVPVDARVRVEDDAAGVTEVEASRGEYVVFGVAGQARVTVLKDGYETQTRVQTIDAHQRMDFELVYSGTRPDLSGRYRLTVTAAGACTNLPDDVRERSFEAVLEQAGPRLTVTLSGPEFGTDGARTLNQFRGVLDGNRALLELAGPTTYYFYYYGPFTPDIAVRLGPASYYSFDGRIEAVVSGTSISGPLNGGVGRLAGPPYSPSLRCRSTQHRFELTR